MKCKDIEKMIVDFLEKQEDLRNKKEFIEHLEECEKCRNLYNDFLTVLKESKKVRIPEIEQNFWKAKLNYIMEKGEVYTRSLKPIFVGVSLFVLVFSTIFLMKIYTPSRVRISPVSKVLTRVEFTNHELPFSEDEIINYADYMENDEAEKVLDFIFKGL